MNYRYYLTTKEHNTVKEKTLSCSSAKIITLRPFYYILLFWIIVAITTIKNVSTLFSFTVNYLQRNKSVVR